MYATPESVTGPVRVCVLCSHVRAWELKKTTFYPCALGLTEEGHSPSDKLYNFLGQFFLWCVCVCVDRKKYCRLSYGKYLGNMKVN